MGGALSGGDARLGDGAEKMSWQQGINREFFRNRPLPVKISLENFW